MKKLIYNSLLLGGILLMASCSNSVYELQNLVPGKYHKILYIKDNGKQEMNMNTVETTPVYSIRIVKAGSDPSSSADVKVVTMSQDEIDELYNDIEGTNYRVVSDTSYSYSSPEVVFQAGEVGKRLDVTLYSDLIYAEMQQDKDAQYVLPVKITSDQDSINSYKNHVLLLLDVKKPIITFKTEKISTNMVYKQLAVNIKADLKNISASKWNFTCELTDAQKDDLVSQYNTEHGTNYLPMPSDAYTLEDLTFALGSNEGEVNMTISREPLTNDNAYLLPLKLNNTSQEGFDLGESICYLAVNNPKYGTIDCDRSKWKVVFCNSDQKNYGGVGGDAGGVGSLFDNNLDTYWHSAYGDSYQQGVQDPDKFVGKRDMPITIVAEMNEPIIIYSIGWHQRNDSQTFADTKKAEYYTSNDEKFLLGGVEDYSPVAMNNWTYLMERGYEKISGIQWQTASPEILQQHIKGHLLKVKLIESYRDAFLANGAEVYVKQLVAIDGEPIE